jgi:hypothetical protein
VDILLEVCENLDKIGIGLEINPPLLIPQIIKECLANEILINIRQKDLALQEILPNGGVLRSLINLLLSTYRLT